jgi:hypothetical protein
MEFKIEKHKGPKNGWQNYIVHRKVENKKTKPIKQKNGKFRTVSTRIQKFYIAWNGERFAGGKDYKKFIKIFPKSHKVVLDKIINLDKIKRFEK